MKLDKPTNFEEMLTYASKPDVKATVVLLDADGDILVASAHLDETETVELLKESLGLVVGMNRSTTIH